MKNKINEKLNLYGDNIAKVEQYDFSMANSSDEARTLAITSIATICTQKFDSIGSEKLCTKLLTEAHGIPSSAYGFVPVLLSKTKFDKLLFKFNQANLSHGKRFSHLSKLMQIQKFGEVIQDGEYLLTNLRALVNDIGLEASKEFYNTDENEIAIIKKHFKVFKHKMDIRSARQFMRHTTAVWQELSRRYVSGKRVEFEFYISEKMKFESFHNYNGYQIGIDENEFNQHCIERYNQSLDRGVKPQDARDILPLCTYTEIWSGWQPFALENMLTERTAIGTQWELRQTAIAMQELIKEEEKIC
jgi:thymidylate synthase (FAD)